MDLTLTDALFRLHSVPIENHFSQVIRSAKNQQHVTALRDKISALESEDTTIWKPHNAYVHAPTDNIGDLIDLYRDVHPDAGFEESIDALLQLRNHRLKTTAPLREEDPYEVLKTAQHFFAEHVDNAKHYLVEERGFDDEQIQHWELGYSADEKQLLQILRSEYSSQAIRQSGILSDNPFEDRLVFRDRLTFPIKDVFGRITGFGARDITDTQRAKYLNSAGSVDDVQTPFEKSSSLFGIDTAARSIAQSGIAYIVEGYTDVMAAHKQLPNTVATCGTAFTQSHALLLKNYTSKVAFVMDGDAAGQKSTKRGIKICLEYGITPSVVLLPQGEDLDSLLRLDAIGAREVIDIFSEPISKVYFPDESSTREVTDVLKSFLPDLASIDEPQRFVDGLLETTYYSFDEQLIQKEVLPHTPAYQYVVADYVISMMATTPQKARQYFRDLPCSTPSFPSQLRGLYCALEEAYVSENDSFRQPLLLHRRSQEGYTAELFENTRFNADSHLQEVVGVLESGFGIREDDLPLYFWRRLDEYDRARTRKLESPKKTLPRVLKYVDFFERKERYADAVVTGKPYTSQNEVIGSYG